MWIHEQADWPNFTWDIHYLAERLGQIRFRQGLLIGRMQELDFELKQETNLVTSH